MRDGYEDSAKALTTPNRLYVPSEITGAITKWDATGVYAWWFKNLPENVPLDDAIVFGGMRLLYVGTSTGPIRARIKAHLDGLHVEYGPHFVQRVGTLLAFTPDEWDLDSGSD